MTLDSQLCLSVGDWVHIQPNDDNESSYIGKISAMYHIIQLQQNMLYIQWGDTEQSFSQVCFEIILQMHAF